MEIPSCSTNGTDGPEDRGDYPSAVPGQGCRDARCVAAPGACGSGGTETSCNRKSCDVSDDVDSLKLKSRREVRNLNADSQLKLETIQRELELSAEEEEKVLRSIIQGLNDVQAASCADTQNAHAMTSAVLGT